MQRREQCGLQSQSLYDRERAGLHGSAQIIGVSLEALLKCHSREEIPSSKFDFDWTLLLLPGPTRSGVSCLHQLSLEEYLLHIRSIVARIVVTNMSDSITTLTVATQDRKARLAQLKSLKRKAPTTNEDDESSPRENIVNNNDEPESASVASKILSGRNYDPETRGPKLGFEAAPDEGQETVEAQARQLAEETKQQADKDALDDKPLDLFKLQPKKPNWDLKRDLDKKLEILNVRTENAIAKIVRERIAKAQEAAKKKGAVQDGEAVGMEGTTLVEAVHLREKEEEEDKRREREADEELLS